MTVFLVMIMFCIFALTLQITGLILLIKQGDRNIYGTQKYLITTLSIIDITFLTLSATLQYISQLTDMPYEICAFVISYKVMVLVNMFYFTVFGIIIDRFLQIRLNIRYKLYWNKDMSKKLLLDYCVMLNVFYFTYLTIALSYQQYSLNMKILETFQKYLKLFTVLLLRLLHLQSISTFSEKYISTGESTNAQRKMLLADIKFHIKDLHLIYIFYLLGSLLLSYCFRYFLMQY